MKEKIEKWYTQGLWTQEMVQQAAARGVITQADADELLQRCVLRQII